MKETTKKKIIKTAKIAGMVMTAFFAVLGLAFSAAALNKCSGGEDKRVPAVTLNNAPNYSYVEKGISSYVTREFNGVYASAYTSTSVTLIPRSGVDVWELSFTNDVYIIFNEIQWIEIWSLSNTSEYNHLVSCLNNVVQNQATYTCAELTTFTRSSIDSSHPYHLQAQEGYHYFLMGWRSILTNVDVLDLYYDEPLYSVNWGFQWFPWQMLGYAGSNPVILSDISGSIEDLHVIEHRYLDGFYFRANGKLYKKIDFMYSWASGSELTDGSGKFYTVSNANAWYMQEVRYYYGDGADDYDVVARFSIFESPTNHYNIPAYGPLAWVSPAFRQIDIVYIVDDNAIIATNTGSYTLSQWIEILLQPMSGDININVIQGGDPFSLMTTAFDSMKGILSIAVLPGISLGLLLFLPIIAGIIVIILRVVKR